MIAVRYLSNGFFRDFIPLIPLQLITIGSNGRGTLFYLIKLIRLQKGFEILDVSTLINSIKAVFNKHKLHMIATNPDWGKDMHEDKNHI